MRIASRNPICIRSGFGCLTSSKISRTRHLWVISQSEHEPISGAYEKELGKDWVPSPFLAHRMVFSMCMIQHGVAVAHGGVLAAAEWLQSRLEKWPCPVLHVEEA